MRAQRCKIQACGIEGIEQHAALAAGQRDGGEPVALGHGGVDEAFGGLDQLVEPAHADHAFTGCNRVERLDRARQCAGVRHCGGTAAFR